MHTTNRRASLIAILLSALAVLLLSACGTPDQPASAAQPTVAPTASATALDVTAAPTSDTVPATLTPTAIDNTAAPTAEGTATAEATPPAATTTAVPAVTATPIAPDATDPFTDTDDVAGTDGLTVTVALTATGELTVTHPVALAISDYFTVPLSEVIGLHADGLGFGGIARAYFLARELAADGDPTNDLTAVQILAMHQGGMGWGQIVAQLDLPRGNSGRNLGQIMRARKERQEDVAVSTGAETDQGHGPPAVPPGQLKDKDKDHGNGNGNGNSNGNGNGNGKGDGKGNGNGKGNGKKGK
jgi:hypothetical protein